MQIKVLKSKIHLATVTGASLEYHGSLTLDRDLMDAVGLLPYEAVLVSNTATGARGETYALPGERGSGRVELNGAMARLGSAGDRIIVMAFAWLDAGELRDHRPRVAATDRNNRIVEHIPYDELALDPRVRGGG